MLFDVSFLKMKLTCVPLVWQHMIGNTYPYTPAMWAADIKLAHESGFDGFALNIGTDSWQIKQLGAAYDAAAAYGSDFKLFSPSTSPSNPAVDRVC